MNNNININITNLLNPSDTHTQIYEYIRISIDIQNTSERLILDSAITTTNYSCFRLIYS